MHAEHLLQFSFAAPRTGGELLSAEDAYSVIDSDDEDFDEVDAELRAIRAASALRGDGDAAAGAPLEGGAHSVGASHAPAAVGASATAAAAAAPNRQPVAAHKLTMQPRDHAMERFRDRINLSLAEEVGGVATARHTGRDDRATVEQVLDPRTRLILFKLLNQGVIASIHGCVSTGKEANVYHAFRPDGSELAIKIYKTSILVFKDRDRYVSGEFRFKSGYSRSNPRKMVKLWAEKETRNLKRLAAAGVPVPTPVLLRMHVLLMDFIGVDGYAAPRLRDAGLTPRQLTAAYGEVVRLMRRMFTACRLVHADLSEYNMCVVVRCGGGGEARGRGSRRSRMNDPRQVRDHRPTHTLTSPILHAISTDAAAGCGTTATSLSSTSRSRWRRTTPARSSSSAWTART
jgi:RIO kinase 1